MQTRRQLTLHLCPGAQLHPTPAMPCFRIGRFWHLVFTYLSATTSSTRVPLEGANKHFFPKIASEMSILAFQIVCEVWKSFFRQARKESCSSPMLNDTELESFLYALARTVALSDEWGLQFGYQVNGAPLTRGALELAQAQNLQSPRLPVNRRLH